MFVPDPFDIAPHASRPTRASWITLIFGLTFASACAVLLRQSLQTVGAATEASRTIEQLSRATAASEAATRLRLSDPANLERFRAQQRLQQVLRISWSGLLDALELAGQHVDGRAAIVSLTPVKTEADSAEVSITALAVSNENMVNYVRALQKHPQVREVRLLMQQPAQSRASAVVRFQLSMWWDPSPGHFADPSTTADPKVSVP